MSLNSKVEEKQKSTLDREREKLGQLKQCVAIAASSPEGLVAFRHIMTMCGYNKSIVSGNPATGDIYDRGTLYNAARENIWKELRQLIPIKARKKIEYEQTIYLEGEGND